MGSFQANYKKNKNMKVAKKIGKYLTPFSPTFSVSKLSTKAYNCSTTACHLLGTKVALNVTNSRSTISKVITISVNNEELVKDILKLPKPMGIIETILNCSRGEKINILRKVFHIR